MISGSAYCACIRRATESQQPDYQLTEEPNHAKPRRTNVPNVTFKTRANGEFVDMTTDDLFKGELWQCFRCRVPLPRPAPQLTCLATTSWRVYSWRTVSALADPSRSRYTPRLGTRPQPDQHLTATAPRPTRPGCPTRNRFRQVICRMKWPYHSGPEMYHW